MNPKPMTQVLQASAVRTSPLRSDIEPVRSLRALQDRLQAPVQPALRVFKREVEHITALAGDVTHGAGARSYGDSEVQRKPALARLGLAGQECQPLRYEFGDRPLWFAELFRHQIRRRDKLEH